MRKLSSLLSVFLLIFGAVYFLQFSNSKGQQIEFDLPYSANAEETSENSGHIIEMTQGDQDASVEMIEYASFTCPHCAKFHSDVYPELKADYIDKGLVKFIYREVYFDTYGMWASMIARCAGPEKFFGMTDQIYRKQSDWARAESDIAIVSKLRKIGLLAGLDEEKLNTCLQDLSLIHI